MRDARNINLMNSYRWKAMDAQGQEQSGITAAASPDRVVAMLREKGFFPINVELDRPVTDSLPRPDVPESRTGCLSLIIAGAAGFYLVWLSS